MDVVLLERAEFLGGRAGGWRTTLADGSEVPMNRGFHAFFRQYYNLRGLLERADPGLDGLTPVTDYPLVHSSGLRDTFRGLARTPLWNALCFAARSPTFTWGDIARLGTRAALPLADVSVPATYHQLDDTDAGTFLERIRFPRAARHLAFEVFARSFFSAPEQLSAAELATMFHIYFLGSNEGLLFDLPTDCFAPALWQPLQRYLAVRGVEVRTGSAVEQIGRGARRSRAVRLESGSELEVDGVVLATDPAALRSIVKRSPGLGDPQWRERVGRLRNADPFLVSRLWLDRPVRTSRSAFLGTSGFGPVDNVSVLERYERSARDWADDRGGSVVELHCYALPPDSSVRDLRPRLLAELHRLYPETARARIIDERHEMRADCPLFAPGGFAERLAVPTSEPDVVLAGDFVRIDLPTALMERAATTGVHAANLLLSSWGVRGHELWSVPERGRYALLRKLASVSP
ncbi:NAD(P)/FAD-dependent oxidoreductase [Parasphingorhabdus pacifica]